MLMSNVGIPLILVYVQNIIWLLDRFWIQEFQFPLAGVFHCQNVLRRHTRWELLFIDHALECTDGFLPVFEQLCQWLIFGPWLVLDEYSLGLFICDWIARLAILTNWQEDSILMHLRGVVCVVQYFAAEMLVEVVIHWKIGEVSASISIHCHDVLLPFAFLT